ncbi:MAG: metallophosphoesterase [Cyanobacteria bacterium SZAS LIN-3]|nr:metallophosphoesterase [Cyanobacteria bacterium SZAS LIN-3]MBS2005950.1 metallophosphoesterase [Cyanobacteria bacterium SZAS TMP-1]
MTNTKVTVSSASDPKDASRRVRRIVDKLARSRNLNIDSVRQALRDAIKRANDMRALGFLHYAGVLDLHLPDGTKVAIIPDWHIPAHDRQVTFMVKQWLAEFRPDIIILIGDAADMFGLSRWPKPPRVVANTQMELDETRRIVDEVIECSGCLHLFYILGNHEDRGRRSQIDPNGNVASLLDPTTNEPILNFHQLMGYKPGDPITFIYGAFEDGGFGGGILTNDEIKFIHGNKVRPKPGASPYAEADAAGKSIGQGHTHRYAKRARRNTKNGLIRSYEFGFLGDERHPYLGYAFNTNWHQGVASGHVHGGLLHIQMVPIKKIKNSAGQIQSVMLADGKLYQSSGY